MSFRQFVEEAEALVRSALSSLGYDPPAKLDWDIPPSEELGDVSFRVGYQLTKVAKKKPVEIAQEIANEIETKFTSEKHLVATVAGHPSGFLNFRINLHEFSSAVLTEAIEEGYGSLDLGKNQNVLVEHTSVNPNKALHVGHLRNVALGDSVARILRFTNHSVKVLNYIDDSGLQVADVIVGVLYLGHSIDGPQGKKYDRYVGDDVYVDVNKKYQLDPSLKEKQKFVLKAIEEHDEKIFTLAESITDKILQEQLHTCWRFNASYDLLVYESDIIKSRLWERTFSDLKERGIALLEKEGKLAGCWIVSIKGEKEGEDKVLVR
ncbi:MAG: arginine--tRNA ligase, partial [Nitrososphaerales archaeon]